MRWFGFGMMACTMCGPSWATADNAVTGQELSKITAVLASLNCRVKPDNIEKQGEEFILSDVFCAEGQFDIRLNAMFKVIAKRVE